MFFFNIYKQDFKLNYGNNSDNGKTKKYILFDAIFGITQSY